MHLSHEARNDHTWKMLIQKPNDLSDVLKTHKLIIIEVFWSAEFVHLINFQYEYDRDDSIGNSNTINHNHV